MTIAVIDRNQVHIRALRRRVEEWMRENVVAEQARLKESHKSKVNDIYSKVRDGSLTHATAPTGKRRGLPRAMVSCSGTVASDPETVRAKDGSELLLVRVVGERQGEPERLAFWVEGRAAEVIRGPAGWKVGDTVQIKLILVGRASHEDLRDGREGEMMARAVQYTNDIEHIREDLKAELLEALGLDEWPEAVPRAQAIVYPVPL